MVKELPQGEVTLYVCEACDLAYKEKEWAQKCQEWCEQYQSCNMEIIRHAVPRE